jgi:hypothetical protein
MEQYWMPKKLDFENLRLCIDNYSPDFLYIRLVGSMGGKVKVNEKLEGLHMLINSDEVFHFPLKDYQKGFSLAYERIETTENGVGRMVMLSEGVNPYDPNLPEPRRSFLRTALDDHLMEIGFKGRINLKFHSWRKKPYRWKYWTIDKPGNMQEIILEQQIEHSEEDS